MRNLPQSIVIVGFVLAATISRNWLLLLGCVIPFCVWESIDSDVKNTHNNLLWRERESKLRNQELQNEKLQLEIKLLGLKGGKYGRK